MATWRVIHRAILSILLLALVLVFRLHLNVFERLELVFQDQLQTLFPAPPPAPENAVTIVAVDDRSLRELGQWPWPRSVHATLVRRLHEAGARVIGFDALFPDPDRSGPQSDQDFADALHGARGVLGLAGAPAEELTEGRVLRASFHMVLRGPELTQGMLNTVGVVRNIPPLEMAAKGEGLVLISVYGDGVMRTQPLVWAVDQRVRPSFAMEVVRVGLAQDEFMVSSVDLGVSDVRFKTGLIVPTNHSGEITLHFRPLDPNKFISAIDVINGTFDPDAIAGKMVMVGATAPGLGDEKVTPLGEIVPGVVVHATAVEQILSGHGLHRSLNVGAIEIVIFVLLGMIFIIALPIVSPWMGLGIFGAAQAGLMGAAAYLFVEQGLVFYPVYPALSLAVLFGVSLFITTVRSPQS